MQTNRLLTLSQAAGILKINENTLSALAAAGQIPHIKIHSAQSSAPQLRFNTFEINDWLSQDSLSAVSDTAYIEKWQKRLEEKFPKQLADLREYDKCFTPPRKPKGYSLVKFKNKKLGFVYHVRYIENGKLVPTWWSTHTNDLKAAEEFAVSNREKLLSEYRQRKALKKGEGCPGIYSIFKNFYEKDSSFLKKNAKRGRVLVESTRKSYRNIILAHWIPFLKKNKNKIKAFEEIDTPLLARFQDCCLAKEIKRQSVNLYVIAVSNVFDYLVTMGRIKTNPCGGLPPLRVKDGEREIRGCYNINEMAGIFSRRWGDEQLYLLCLLIYSTGMRNCEIDRIKAKDIMRIKKCWFINIPESKTKSGIRIVPLHDFVYARLKRHIDKCGKGPDDLLFCQGGGAPLPRQRYTDANIALGMLTRQGRVLGPAAIKEKLKKENIVFYSGRHFWKTLMNAHDLGEVEEYFMGHKASGDVAKLYNHRDKQGQGRLAAKAREVFKILDRSLFAGRA